jgi:molecular chaperone DnaJ
MRKRDYYEVLGVTRDAGVPALRRAYQRLARRYSPDVNLWDTRGGGLFEEIVEAYRVLGDPGKRALYDRLGHQAFAPGPAAAGAAPAQGEDVHCPVEIDFESAYRGESVVVDAVRLSPCPACAGTGGREGRGAGPCPACRGRPVRLVLDEERPVAARCQACRGTGWQVPEPCPACAGRGTVPKAVRIPVTIPPGVDTGAQLRLPREGHAAPAPGTPGDLVVITRVREHRYFTRKGEHLCCEVPLTVPEAALGARIQVPIPGGVVALTIPAGTQSGQVFRVRGRGFPRLDREGYGDLLVATRVVIPRNADSTLEEVLRALKRLLPDDPRAGLWDGSRAAAGGGPRA